MKSPTIKYLASVSLDENGNFFEGPFVVGKGPAARTIQVRISVSKEQADEQRKVPIDVSNEFREGCWVFRDRLIEVDNTSGLTHDELLLHIKHDVLRTEGKLSRLQRQIEAFENLDRIPSTKREKIAESARLFIWQRDEGKCVKCGGRENLEFDHIIPVADGGSNTERNIQLLCEQCNRQKGKSVS